MKLFNFQIPTGAEKEVTAVETWVVQWESMDGGYSFADLKKSYQSFPDKKSAMEFAERLKQAHKLLRNKGHTSVYVDRDMPIN